MRKGLSYVIEALALVTVVTLGNSCTKEALELTYASQEDKIDKYITSLVQKDTTLRVEYNDGVSRVVLKEGSGAELGAGGNVSIFWGGYTFTTGFSMSNLFATNDIAQAESAGWDTKDKANFNELNININDKGLLSGLRSGLKGVREGEECYVIFSGKHGFGKKSVGTVPPNSALLYYVKVTFVAK